MKPADTRAISEMYAYVYENEFVAPLNTLAKTIYPRRLDRRKQEDKRTNTTIQAEYKIGRILLHFSKFVRFSDVDYYFFFFEINIDIIDWWLF